jgi:hypothetical protein
VIILTVLCLLACGICAGFCAGMTLPALWTGRQKAPKPPTPLTREQEKELRRRRREMLNFFNYNGDPMPETDDDRPDFY